MHTKQILTPASRRVKYNVKSTSPSHTTSWQTATQKMSVKSTQSSLTSGSDKEPTIQSNKTNFLSTIYSLTGVLSAISWIVTSYVALSYHPDPKFSDCTLRHNLLTISQALAFPIPILWATFETLRQCSKGDGDRNSIQSNSSNRIICQRLNLAVALASLWLAASLAFAPAFAFGYDLYTFQHKWISSTIHMGTALFALTIALKSASLGEIVRGINDSLWNFGPVSGHKNSSCYATGALGLLYFTIQPVVAPYPLATIPTILGKRLSRPASAFTLLGSVMAYCLKEKQLYKNSEKPVIRNTLRKGIAWGSAAHLSLIMMKLAGVDGGGLLFRGRGLWEVYPAMISVPFAAAVSFGVHGILCFGAWTDDDEMEESNNTV